MVDINECPVCQSRSLVPFRTCQDFTVSHETFQVVRCENCTLGITTPRPETEKLGDYYKSEEYISHSGKSSGLMGPLYKTARNFALNQKAKLVGTYSKPGLALDFGCGTGEFLATLKKHKWAVEGIEPSPVARQKAEENTSQKIHSELETIKNTYDIITAWHVVEHVPDLIYTINTLKEHLKKDGTIFIAVPNYESTDAEQYGNLWAGFDVPRHLWHFSKKSMVQLLNSNGLTLRITVPMKLDAFYVSMLSENYRSNTKTSVATMAKGFLSGLKSNAAAGSDNYSSLIYIAQHS